MLPATILDYFSFAMRPPGHHFVVNEVALSWNMLCIMPVPGLEPVPHSGALQDLVTLVCICTDSFDIPKDEGGPFPSLARIFVYRL